MTPRPPSATLFPYTTLFRSRDDARRQLQEIPDMLALLLGQESWEDLAARFADRRVYWFVGGGPNTATAWEAALKIDRKSTRLNSSHVAISYAVFCLKKKTTF